MQIMKQKRQFKNSIHNCASENKLLRKRLNQRGKRSIERILQKH